MGFRTGAYATVWKVQDGKGNYKDVQLSTSRKNKQTDEYETDFSGFVRFIGTAANAAASLKERDRIKIGDCDVTNHYDKEKGVTYTNYAVFTFENANGGNGGAKVSSNTDGFPDIMTPDDETELPFN